MRDLLASHGARLADRGCVEHEFDALAQAGTSLPDAHRAVLGVTNGFAAYGGYFRLFGVGPGSFAIVGTDLIAWNDVDTWKLAWPATAQSFFCFGETAWGDQYAYSVRDLAQGRACPVYFLDALSLEPRALAETFDDFFEKELLRNCSAPYDDMLVAARRVHGELGPSEHVIYTPSPLVTGVESIEHVTKIDAVAGMIINGDLARELGNAPRSRPLERLEPYLDDRGRMRLRAIWGA